MQQLKSYMYNVRWIVFLTTILGMFFLFGCNKINVPESELETELTYPETYSWEYCSNVNWKNLVATMANKVNPERKAAARSVLAHSKLGKYVTIIGWATTHKNQRRTFVKILAPAGGYNVFIDMTFTCDNVTKRPTSLQKFDVIKFKQNYAADSRHKRIYTFDSTYIRAYEMPSMNASTLKIQGSPKFLFTARIEDGHIVNPKNYNDASPKHLLPPLDLDNIVINPRPTRPTDKELETLDDDRVKPYISDCEECKTEAQKFSREWDYWDRLQDIIDENNEATNKAYAIYRGDLGKQATSGGVAVASCATAAALVTIPQCGVAATAFATFSGIAINSGRAHVKKREAERSSRAKFVNYMIPPDGSKGQFNIISNNWYNCRDRHPKQCKR